MGGPEEDERGEGEEEAGNNGGENDEGWGQNLSSHDAMTSGNWSKGLSLDLLQLPFSGIPLSDGATVTQRRNPTTLHMSCLSDTSERRDNGKQQ